MQYQGNKNWNGSSLVVRRLVRDVMYPHFRNFHACNHESKSLSSFYGPINITPLFLLILFHEYVYLWLCSMHYIWSLLSFQGKPGCLLLFMDIKLARIEVSSKLYLAGCPCHACLWNIVLQVKRYVAFSVKPTLAKTTKYWQNINSIYYFVLFKWWFDQQKFDLGYINKTDAIN